MEIWDAYYEDGTLAGRELVRGEPIPQGLYHLICEVLVRHTDGDYLLMRRDPRKPHYGGFWEATAGGSALKGEDAQACIRRELWEETGIRAGTLEQIGCSLHPDTIFCSFLCITDGDKASVRLQEGETVAYKWVSEGEFVAFVNSEAMIGIQKDRYRDYFEKIGYFSRLL